MRQENLPHPAGPTATDETATGHDGCYFGNPTFGTPGAIVGDPDTAVQFNSAEPLRLTDYVEIPDSADFSQPTSTVGLTVEVWMRPDVQSH